MEKYFVKKNKALFLCQCLSLFSLSYTGSKCFFAVEQFFSGSLTAFFVSHIKRAYQQGMISHQEFQFEILSFSLFMQNREFDT